MKQVGIMSSVYRNWNFGGMLQGYALCRKIRELGYEDAEHICRSPGREGNSVRDRVWTNMGKYALTRDIRDTVYRVLTHDPVKLKNFKSFEREEIPEGKYSGDVTTLPYLNQEYRCFVTGSDQVWNPQFFGDAGLRMFGLTFADTTKRKISYAVSMGTEKAAVGKEDIFREILNGLSSISVRERAARDFLQPLTEKPIEVVVDPTMLLTGDDWSKVAIKPQENKPYIFSYFLRETTNPHYEQVQYILDCLDLPMQCIATEIERYTRKSSKDVQVYDAGPKEFVGYILQSEVVLTNSFHGMVFSVLLHKPFWVFKRNRSSEDIDMNARITDFLQEFGLEDRLIEDGEFPSREKLERSIDYQRVDQMVAKRREESLMWLKDALEG